MKNLLGIILALAASAAFATQTNTGTTCNGNGSCGTTNNNTTNNAGGQGGNASATGGTHIQTNTQTTIVTPVTTSGAVAGSVSGSKSKSDATAVAPTTVAPTQTVTFEAKRIPVAGASAPSVATTASCRVGVSGGVQTAVVGISAGGSYKDKPCDKRALGLAKISAAQIAHSMGANPEYFAQLFEEGVALLNESADADEEQPAKKSIGGGSSNVETLNP